MPRAVRDVRIHRPVCHLRTGTIRAPVFSISRRGRATAGWQVAGIARPAVQAPAVLGRLGDLGERIPRPVVSACIMEGRRAVIAVANCFVFSQAWSLPAVREDTNGIPGCNLNLFLISGAFTCPYAVIPFGLIESPPDSGLAIAAPFPNLWDLRTRHKMPPSRCYSVSGPGGAPPPGPPARCKSPEPVVARNGHYRDCGRG